MQKIIIKILRERTLTIHMFEMFLFLGLSLRKRHQTMLKLKRIINNEDKVNIHKNKKDFDT